MSTQVIARPRAVQVKGSKRRKCELCDRFVNKLNLDNGKQDKRTKGRGRPSKVPEPVKPRREHVGWWCKHCRVFLYLDEDISQQLTQATLHVE